MKFPENRSIWLYTGKGPGRGMPHMVIGIDPKENEITTWSSFDKDPTNGGYSWLGTSEDFRKNFNPTEPAAA